MNNGGLPNSMQRNFTGGRAPRNSRGGVYRSRAKNAPVEFARHRASLSANELRDLATNTTDWRHNDDLRAGLQATITRLQEALDWLEGTVAPTDFINYGNG